MICKVRSSDVCGIDAYEICVEADVSGGLPGFYMVGLPSSEVREAKERVERAIVNSGFEFPARKITINLSPAYLKKQGSGLDLPIAVAVLAAIGTINPTSLDGRMFVGELSLDGSINKVKGILPIAAFAREKGVKCLVVPGGNAFEGAAVEGIAIHGTTCLKTLVQELNKNVVRDVDHMDIQKELDTAYSMSNLDYGDVVGQESAKMATLTAVSGFHNLMYVGPPGSGKSMMARRIPTILNKMTPTECLEVSKIYSIAGLLPGNKLILERPFRCPNQSVTDAALLGGSANPRPGEVTLAHKGVLFLDELTEFRKNTIDELRLPLEDKRIVINRSRGSVEFPCDFMLVAATNPCKCGFYPDRRYCRCNEADVARYLSKIKGPVLDRIDICIGVSKVEAKNLGFQGDVLTSAQMREMSMNAQKIQSRRFKGLGINFNSQMTKQMADRFCTLDSDARNTLTKAYERMNMTARGWYKILKVSRTIADLEGEENILKKHVLTAIGYRNSFINN